MLKEVIEKNINDIDKILNALGIRIDNSQRKKIETSLIVREEEKKINLNILHFIG